MGQYLLIFTCFEYCLACTLAFCFGLAKLKKLHLPSLVAQRAALFDELFQFSLPYICSHKSTVQITLISYHHVLKCLSKPGSPTYKRQGCLALLTAKRLLITTSVQVLPPLFIFQAAYPICHLVSYGLPGILGVLEALLCIFNFQDLLQLVLLFVGCPKL